MADKRSHKRPCAGKPDGSPCSGPARRGTDYCRHHQPRGTATAAMGKNAQAWVSRRKGRNPPYITPEEQEQFRWYDELLECLRNLPLEGDQRAPLLEGDFPKDEPGFVYGGRKLPQAALVVFPPDGSIRFALGVAPVAQSVTRVEAEEEGAYRYELRGPWREYPFVVFGLWLGKGLISAHPRVPRTANGLPDLRIFQVPHEQWPELRKSAVSSDAGYCPHPVCALPMVEAPNNHADRDLQLALALKERPEAWGQNKDEGHCYYQGKQALVIYRPNEIFAEGWFTKDELRDNTLKLLDDRFREMRNDLVADVADLLFLHWIANGRPAKARITLSQVLEYRGVKPERKSFELHWRAMRDARSIRLRDATIDAALFEMDSARMAQGNLFALPEPPSADVVYAYSPGAFVSAAVGQNSPYLAAYTPRFLTLDPRNYSTAKRLARYLRGEWRMNPEGYLPGGRTRYRTWREHLADAGVDPKSQFTGCNRPSEFIDSLDDQLLELCRVGGIQEWVPGLHRPKAVKRDWQEAAALYHPQDRERLQQLPYRNRMEAFLALRVHLPPPADLLEKLTHYAQLRSAREAQRRAIANEVAVRGALKVNRKG
jgi:hypothetical protein